MDEQYKRMRDADLPRAIDAIERLVETGQRRFAELWPIILEGHHVTVSALAREVKRAADAGRLVVEGLGKRERTVKEDNLVRRS